MRTSGSEAGVVAFAGLAATPASSPRQSMTTPGSELIPPAEPAGLAVTPASSLSREHGEYHGRRLSPREYQALTAYARLGDRGQAAAELGIQLTTFKGLMEMVYAKLGVDHIIGALWAMGWLTLPDEALVAVEVGVSMSLATAHELRDAADQYIAVLERVGASSAAAA
jgi:DNA-binding CsgD family transcriptional regulator